MTFKINKCDNVIVGLLILVLNWQACTTKPEKKEFILQNKNATHINFENRLTSTPDLNILNYLYFYNGAGVAVADFNNDGLPDLFFTGNQVQNELYINKGRLQFLNATQPANIPASNWSTGVTIVDINQDGLMDIYICQVTGIGGKKTYNQLLVNQGIDETGIPIFKEMARDYGVNISSYSQQAAFFDFDMDGDLDMFLLNHSLHPNRTYGDGSKRESFDEMAGDKLFENVNGKFVEITKQSKIFSSSIGYGLDLSISDINLDGYPDLYVGNDFFENDYLYINNHNKTFDEIISKNQSALGHTTHFSMGNDIADLDNNLHPDIISVDMLPENTKEYKLSGTDYPYLTYQQYLKNNYAPQYMSNTLHLNYGNLRFSEVANYKNIAATDWSWSAIIADFNNDLMNDIFIANGILGATNNMDFINFISNKTFQNKINEGLTQSDLALLDELPTYKKHNKLFINNNSTFNDVFNNWEGQPASYSNGATYTDLNNDGALDIIVNNINDKAFVYKNQASKNYLKVKFNGKKPNINAIGAKVLAFIEDKTIIRENFVNRGYMSSTMPEVHFGLNNYKKVDSLWVIWPDNTFDSFYDIEANQSITLKQNDNFKTFNYSFFQHQILFQKLPSNLIPFEHREFESYEFSRNPLAPYMSSNLGPKISVVDFNQDGLEDVFIGNAKKQPSRLYLQQPNGSFSSFNPDLFNDYATNEDLAHHFFDFDNDGDLDLLLVSGGNEFKKGKPITPRLYINTDNNLILKEDVFNQIEGQFNTVALHDINGDGYLDLFIGAGIDYETFGKSPKSYLLINKNGNGFEDETIKYFGTHHLGMIRDAKFADLDKDGQSELFLVGHFMPLSLYKLNDDKFSPVNIEAFSYSNGLYNFLEIVDIDGDGYLDVFVGNLGQNTKLKANANQPLTLYLNDFNSNGQTEGILTYYHNNTEVVFHTKDELTTYIPKINKQFRSYESFANASIASLFDNSLLKQAEKKHVYNLKSVCFKNFGKLDFAPVNLPDDVQYSALNAAVIDDLNGDGTDELILVGNKFDISTQLGRLDANHGLVLTYRNGHFEILRNHNLNLKAQINSAKKIQVKDQTWFLFGTNNDSLQIIRKAFK